MKCIRKILKQKKGMTLVEVIVSLAVFSILTLSVAMLLTPSINVYVKSTNLSRSNLILENVISRVSDELMYATEFTPDTDWTTGMPAPDEMKKFRYISSLYGWMEFENAADGVKITQVSTGKTPLFGEDFYQGNRVTVEVKPMKPAAEPDEIYNMINIKAMLYDSGDREIGAQEKRIQLLNTDVRR